MRSESNRRSHWQCCKEVTAVRTPDRSVSYNELELSKEEMGSHVPVVPLALAVARLERRVSDPRLP